MQNFKNLNDLCIIGMSHNIYKVTLKAHCIKQKLNLVFVYKVQ